MNTTVTITKVNDEYYKFRCEPLKGLTLGSDMEVNKYVKKNNLFEKRFNHAKQRMINSMALIKRAMLDTSKEEVIKEYDNLKYKRAAELTDNKYKEIREQLEKEVTFIEK